MKITAQQFVSNNHEKGTFVTVFKHYSQDSSKTTEKEGEIYCLFSLSGGEHLPAERVSKFVWDGILDGYLYSTNKSTNDSLKDAITSGVKKLKSLIKNEKNLEELGVNLNFVLVAQKKEGLYIGNLGDNEIYVLKEGTLVNVMDILGKSKASTAGIALKSGDILIAATSGVISNNLPRLKGLKSTDEILDSLKMIGRELKESSGLIFFAYVQAVNIPEIKKEPISISNPLENIGPLIKEFKINPPKVNIDRAKIKKILANIKNVFKMICGKISPYLERISAKIHQLYLELKVRLLNRFEKKRWFKKVASKVSTVKINTQRYSPKGMRIDGYRIKNKQTKRIRLVIFVLLGIVLLVLGINFVIKTKKANEIHSQAVTILNNADTIVKKAENSSTSDKTSTETAIYQAQNTLKELPNNLNAKDTATEQSLNTRILAVQDFLYKRTPVSESNGKLSTFLDTKLAFGENSKPSDIDIYTDTSGNEYLVVTDTGLNAVFRISLYDKSLTRIQDPSGLIKDPEYVSMGNTGVFVYDDKTGVVKSAFGDSNSLGGFALLSGLSRSDIQSKDIGEFIVLTASDNVYLLSRDESSLLKSANASDDEYGLNFKYITDSRFANATDILSDLSLYFLTSDSPQLVRYSYDYTQNSQAEDPLQVTGLDGDLSGVTKGYTTGSLDYGLYLFDATNKRFLDLEKPQESENLHPGEAVLKNQIVYRGTQAGMWSNVKDFVVDANGTTMYVLDGTTIWKVML